jgi:hypothetical protein
LGRISSSAVTAQTMKTDNTATKAFILLENRRKSEMWRKTWEMSAQPVPRTYVHVYSPPPPVHGPRRPERCVHFLAAWTTIGWKAGWPDWANFRLLGDGLLWAVLKITKTAQILGLQVSTVKVLL